ncbi:MAG: hypothetical protein ABH806_01530 [Candidatus Omnitrophota bacterium]
MSITALSTPFMHNSTFSLLIPSGFFIRERIHALAKLSSSIKPFSFRKDTVLSIMSGPNSLRLRRSRISFSLRCLNFSSRKA